MPSRRPFLRIREPIKKKERERNLKIIFCWLSTISKPISFWYFMIKGRFTEYQA